MEHRKAPASFAALGLLLFIISLACARSQPDPPADTTHTLTHDGAERTYIVHVPPLYDKNKTTPLVLSFHGGGGKAENQRRVSGFNDLADEKGFIVVYPNGSGRLEENILTWNGGTCCGYALTNNIDDVGFIRELISRLRTEYNIDPKRIYATGLSNGGILSYRLACDASDLFAAIAPVSGTQNYVRCEPQEPVSVIHFHGTDDTRLPYGGGSGDDSVTGVVYNSVEESIKFWRDFNSCSGTPQIQSYRDIQIDAYTGCNQGTEIQLYAILGGKHAWPGSDGPAWPGGDEPTQTISATEIMWIFFASHPKP
jgi:polyhydroxybutyrate depolymerase